MHEMSLAEGVRGIVEDAASGQAFRRVRTLVLEIGDLAAVEVDALRFCLEVVLRGTVADGALIEVQRVPGRGWCEQCAATVDIAQLFDACPRCGGYRVSATEGTGMRVKALEVD